MSTAPLSAFNLGFFTRLDAHKSRRQAYAEALELFVVADELGFDSGWVAQHHVPTPVHPDGGLSSPWTFLSHVAAKTRNLHLGTAVTVLPLEDPVRLAEDVAVVDLLSEGRVELGVGSGADQHSFDLFGKDFAAKRELQAENLRVLRDALAGKPLGPRESVLTPAAPTVGADRLWQGAHNAEAAVRIGASADNLLLDLLAPGSDDPTDVVQKDWIRLYDEALPADATRRAALCRIIFPAASRDEALGHFEAGLRNGFARIKASGKFTDLGDDSIDNVLKRMNATLGHPDDIVASLSQERALPDATDLIVQFEPGTPTLDASINALELLATEVAPALGWVPQHQTALVAS